MRVLIDQQYHLGHHYAYVKHLLPELLSISGDVHVAITSSGSASKEFTNYLSPFQSVRFDVLHEEANPSLPMSDRLRVHQSFRGAVDRVRPDYVLIPSGDAQSTAMALYRWTARGHAPGRVPTEVGIHFGTGRAAHGRKSQMRDLANAVNLGLSGVRRVHLVNQLFYEESRRLPIVGRYFSTVPHPVPAPTPLSKQDARRLLSIPETGRYIGLAASLDSRKAIPEFLAAFRTASTRTDERVLLAGWMNPSHSAVIERDFGDLIAGDRLMLKTGFLDTATYQAALAALDVVCTPYPRFYGLSSTLLEGLAAGRPILANAAGWSDAMVSRFGLGWTCDVLNHQAFVAAIRHALDNFETHQETEPIRRLLRYHTPENFARSWTEGIRGAAGLPAKHPLRWEWVQAAQSG